MAKLPVWTRVESAIVEDDILYVKLSVDRRHRGYWLAAMRAFRLPWWARSFFVANAD